MKESENTILLSQYIVEYLEILHKCLSETTYAGDRPLFRNSIVIVSRWLVDLKNQPNKEVIEIILEPQTDKILLDTWKNDKWGDDEAKGLVNLRSKLKNLK